MSTPHCPIRQHLHTSQRWFAGIASIAAVWGLSISTAVQAFDIGHARIESAPGQPLQFSVLLKELSAQELPELVVRMAPEPIWQELGLTPQLAILQAQVELVPGPQEHTVIARFSSPEIIELPVIDVLFEVQLAQEQQRHQVSLLQPPRPTVQPVLVSAPVPVVPTVTVLSGDNLHGIARQLNSPHGTEYQLLAALYLHNPHAFSRKNMNFLLAGQHLQVPTAEQIQALSDHEARLLYTRHVQQFNQYKEVLAQGGTAVEAEKRLVTEPQILSASAPDEGSLASNKSLTKESPLAEQGARLRLSQEGVDDAALLRADAQQAQSKAIEYLEQDLEELDSNIQQLEEILAKTNAGANPVAEMVSNENETGIAMAQPSMQAAISRTDVAQVEGAEVLEAEQGATGGNTSALNEFTSSGAPNNSGADTNQQAAGHKQAATAADKQSLSLLQVEQQSEQQMSWLQMHFLKLMLALLFFIIVFTVWIMRRANKTTIELEAPDRVTPEMIQAKLDDINLDLDTPPSDEPTNGKTSP